MTETIFWLVLAGIVLFVAGIGIWAAVESNKLDKEYQDWVVRRNQFIDFMEGKKK